MLARQPELQNRLGAKGIARKTFASLTYTQWEAWLAIGLDKKLLIVQPAKETVRASKSAPTDATRTAHAQHLKRLRAIDRFPGPPFKNENNLVLGRTSIGPLSTGAKRREGCGRQELLDVGGIGGADLVRGRPVVSRRVGDCNSNGRSSRRMRVVDLTRQCRVKPKYRCRASQRHRARPDPVDVIAVGVRSPVLGC